MNKNQLHALIVHIYRCQKTAIIVSFLSFKQFSTREMLTYPKYVFDMGPRRSNHDDSMEKYTIYHEAKSELLYNS